MTMFLSKVVNYSYFLTYFNLYVPIAPKTCLCDLTLSLHSDLFFLMTSFNFFFCLSHRAPPLFVPDPTSFVDLLIFFQMTNLRIPRILTNCSYNVFLENTHTFSFFLFYPLPPCPHPGLPPLPAKLTALPPQPPFPVPLPYPLHKFHFPFI